MERILAWIRKRPERTRKIIFWASVLGIAAALFAWRAYAAIRRIKGEE